MQETCAFLQMEEIKALSALYGIDLVIKTSQRRCFSISIKENGYDAVLMVTMPLNYPLHESPRLEVSAPWMDKVMTEKVYQGLFQAYLKNVGKPIVRHCVETLKNLLQSVPPKKSNKIDVKPIEEKMSQLNINCPKMVHIEVIDKWC